jgi:ABC-type sugar transport system permease subunit
MPPIIAKRKRADIETKRAYWAMVLPAFLTYLLVMGFPIVLSVILSVSNYNGGRMFGGQAWGLTGLQQYSKVLADPYFWSALKNNAYIVLISVFGQLPLGFVFAYIIYRKIVKWPDFWQGILYVPNIISVIVVGILWQTIFSPYGPLAEAINSVTRHDFIARLSSLFAGPDGYAVNDGLVRRILELVGPAAVDNAHFANPAAELKDILVQFGPAQHQDLINAVANLFAPKWTADFLSVPDVAMLPILFVILWMYTGMYLIMFLANMQKIDTQVIESARIDGAHEGQVMRYIILPAMSGVVVNSAILAISGSLSSFALVFAMTGGGPARVTNILSIYMYDSAFRGAPNFPLANAIALIMVIISFALIGITKVIETRVGGKGE